MSLCQLIARLLAIKLPLWLLPENGLRDCRIWRIRRNSTVLKQVLVGTWTRVYACLQSPHNESEEKNLKFDGKHPYQLATAWPITICFFIVYWWLITSCISSGWSLRIECTGCFVRKCAIFSFSIKDGMTHLCPIYRCY